MRAIPLPRSFRALSSSLRLRRSRRAFGHGRRRSSTAVLAAPTAPGLSAAPAAPHVRRRGAFEPQHPGGWRLLDRQRRRHAPWAAMSSVAAMTAPRGRRSVFRTAASARARATISRRLRRRASTRRRTTLPAVPPPIRTPTKDSRATRSTCSAPIPDKATANGNGCSVDRAASCAASLRAARRPGSRCSERDSARVTRDPRTQRMLARIARSSSPSARMASSACSEMRAMKARARGAVEHVAEVDGLAEHDGDRRAVLHVVRADLANEVVAEAVDEDGDDRGLTARGLDDATDAALRRAEARTDRRSCCACPRDGARRTRRRS